MKTLVRLLALACFACAAPVLTTSCEAPSERVIAVQTLKALGLTAKTGMDAATDLLKKGQITVVQWQNVAAFYDTRWQPAFTFAVSAARSDLDLASSDLVALATEFASLVSQLTAPTLR